MTEQTAVTVVDQSPAAVVEYVLDDYPEAQYNRLIPTETLGMATDLIRPIVASVRLDIEADTYSSRDLKEGHRAPNARGLSKLADAAGVSFEDEVRLDDGSNPNRAYVRVVAVMVDSTGLKRRAPGSRDYVLDAQPMTDAQRNRAKGYVHEHAATRARHRALRALLSLAQSYPVAELQKPFAVVRFVPNTQHPEIRAAYKAAVVSSITSLYGPEPARALGAGDVVDVPEVAEEEARNVTPPPAIPPTLPGERLAAANSAPVPDFLKAPAPQMVERRQPQSLVAALQESAKGSNRRGPADDEQRGYLNELLGGLGAAGIVPVLVAAWGEAAAVSLTAKQAAAIANIADSYDSPEAFLEAWKAAAGQAAA